MIMIGVALKRASILVACRAAPLPIRASFYLLSVKKMKINQSTIWKLGPATFSDLYSAIIQKWAFQKGADRQERRRGGSGAQGMRGISGPPINRRFLLDYIIIFKRKFQILMSFIFFLNNGFTAMATVEQFQGYYQNIGSYYSANDQLYLSSNYTQNLPQTDFHGNCEAAGQLPTEVPQQEGVGERGRAQGAAVKQKRRIERSTEKEILSAKKNSESNIINQFYSFFSSREKSERIVEKCALLLGKASAQLESILTTFYSTIRFINAKRGRKYVNVSRFVKFFTEEQFGECPSEMRERLERLGHLTLGELCEIFRRCAKYYLKEVSISALLTSKRISVVSKEEHLKKRRKVLRCVLGN